MSNTSRNDPSGLADVDAIQAIHEARRHPPYVMLLRSWSVGGTAWLSAND